MKLINLKLTDQGEKKTQITNKEMKAKPLPILITLQKISIWQKSTLRNVQHQELLGECKLKP